MTARRPYRWQTLIAELRRRRVFRVAIAYIASAFVVVQAAQIYFPALGVPDLAFRAIAVLSLIGLPVAIALAWVFDITPEGVQRTQPEASLPEAWSSSTVQAVGVPIAIRVAAVFVVTVAVLGGVATLTLRGSDAPLDRERVLVMTFENLTGEAALDPVGRMAAEWLTQGLAVTGIVEIVPATTVLASARASGGGEDLAVARQIARELGAGTLVWGTYFSSGGKLSFSAHISDTATGRLLGSPEPVSASIADPAEGLLELRERVMSGLGAILNPRLVGWPGAVAQPWSWAAYQEYADGMERYVASDYLGAATHFGRAFEMDSALLTAALWHANSNANAINIDAARATVAWLEQRRQRLSPYDRAFLDRLSARLRGDLPAMHAAALRMVEIAPSADDAAREAALDALRLNRAEEGLARLRALNPDRGWVRGWREYWFFLAVAHHQLGRHDDELRAVRDGRRRTADDGFMWDFMESTALAGLGRPDAVNARVDDAIQRQRHRVPPAALLANAAAALLAHGHEAAAMELFRRAAAEPAADLAPERVSGRLIVRARGTQLGSALLRADALLITGDLVGAEQAYVELLGTVDTTGFSLEERIRLSALAGVALVAARRGDYDVAARHIDLIATTRRVPEPWRVPYARSRVAAARGELDEGVRLLREAFANGMQHTTNPLEYQLREHDPALHPLRASAGYHELMRPVRYSVHE
jgi:hypothetical protein